MVLLPVLHRLKGWARLEYANAARSLCRSPRTNSVTQFGLLTVRTAANPYQRINLMPIPSPQRPPSSGLFLSPVVAMRLPPPVVPPDVPPRLSQYLAALGVGAGGNRGFLAATALTVSGGDLVKHVHGCSFPASRLAASASAAAVVHSWHPATPICPMQPSSVAGI